MSGRSPEYLALWRVEKARWPLPGAIVFHGSVLQRIVWGATPGRAVNRAWGWIGEQR